MTFSCVAREQLLQGSHWMEMKIKMNGGVGESDQGACGAWGCPEGGVSRRRGGRSHRTPYSAGLKSRVGADARFSATTWDSSTMHNSFGKPNLASLRRHRSMKLVLQAFELPGERQLWGEGQRCRKEPGDLRSHRKGTGYEGKGTDFRARKPD